MTPLGIDLVTFRVIAQCLNHCTTVKDNTVVPPYPWVIHSKTYHGYMKLQIIPNAIYNVIFM
jgi:hypothetical protein